jgi:hypothetical protein
MSFLINFFDPKWDYTISTLFTCEVRILCKMYYVVKVNIFQGANKILDPNLDYKFVIHVRGSHFVQSVLKIYILRIKVALCPFFYHVVA